MILILTLVLVDRVYLHEFAAKFIFCINSGRGSEWGRGGGPGGRWRADKCTCPRVAWGSHNKCSWVINNSPSPSYFEVGHLFSSYVLSTHPSPLFYIQYEPKRLVTSMNLMENPSSDQLSSDDDHSSKIYGLSHLDWSLPTTKSWALNVILLRNALSHWLSPGCSSLSLSMAS